MDSLSDDQLLAQTASSPEAFGCFYGRHETTVLRFFMERVRSPDLAADLTAETFAAALAQAGSFDPARRPALEWLLALANTQVLRAYRVGEVDHAARARLQVRPVALDDRALDRVWQLRGPDRHTAPKPRRSAGIVLGEPAQGSRAITTTESSLLPGVADALVVAAARRHGGRRRRRHVVIGARIALALVTVTWFAGQAVIPDRGASASSTVWLPFEAPHDVAGDFPRLWYHASSPQAPPLARARELLTITTYETGDGTDPRCGALPTMGDTDALVSVLDHPGATRAGYPARPDRFRAKRSAEIERALRACRPGVRASWLPFRDGDRVLHALVVLGPGASERTEALALEILDRVRLDPPSI